MRTKSVDQGNVLLGIGNWSSSAYMGASSADGDIFSRDLWNRSLEPEEANSYPISWSRTVVDCSPSASKGLLVSKLVIGPMCEALVEYIRESRYRDLEYGALYWQNVMGSIAVAWDTVASCGAWSASDRHWK